MNKYAGYWRRLIAFFVDGVLIGLFQKFIRFYFPSQQTISNALSFSEKQANVQITSQNLGIELIIGFVPLLLFAYLVSRYAVTPGKKLMSIMVKSEDGRNLTFIQAILRELGKVVSALPLMLGFIWIFIDKKRQAWHDKFVKSVVLSAN
jgi:uncharacterized RDD family membrane protein YckC